MFGEPGAEIIYPNPGFPIYEFVIKFTGATPVPLPLLEENGFGFKAEDVLSRITPKTRLIIINSPANPTGGICVKAEIDKLVAGLAKHPNVAIMSDEIYSEMLYDGNEHTSLLKYPEIADRLIVLDGWSQDLRDDRLAHGLFGVAEVADRPRDAALHQRAFLRQRRRAVGRHRGPEGPARRDRQDDDGVRRAPEVRGGRAEQAARRLLHHAARRVLRLPQHQGHRPQVEAAGSSACSTKPASPRSPAPASAPIGEGYLRISYANSLDNIAEAIRRMGGFLEKRKKAAE